MLWVTNHSFLPRDSCDDRTVSWRDGAGTWVNLSPCCQGSRRAPEPSRSLSGCLTETSGSWPEIAAASPCRSLSVSWQALSNNSFKVTLLFDSFRFEAQTCCSSDCYKFVCWFPSLREDTWGCETWETPWSEASSSKVCSCSTVTGCEEATVCAVGEMWAEFLMETVDSALIKVYFSFLLLLLEIMYHTVTQAFRS